jgi:two-component system, OmpR family, alkaline phosphatase synthesis response regulator PhoP
MNKDRDPASRHEHDDRKSREHPTILVADDEPALLVVAAAILSRSGYRVLTAPNGNEALRVFENTKDTIHLVISDFAMPGIDGYQFVRSIQDRSPSTAVLLMSAAGQFVTGRGVTAIVKPFTQETLVARVRSLLAECDFAQIRREQSRARSRRCYSKNGSEYEDTSERRPSLAEVTPNSSGARPRTL